MTKEEFKIQCLKDEIKHWKKEARKNKIALNVLGIMTIILALIDIFVK